MSMAPLTKTHLRTLPLGVVSFALMNLIFTLHYSNMLDDHKDTKLACSLVLGAMYISLEAQTARYVWNNTSYYSKAFKIFIALIPTIEMIIEYIYRTNTQADMHDAAQYWLMAAYVFYIIKFVLITAYLQQPDPMPRMDNDNADRLSTKYASAFIITITATLTSSAIPLVAPSTTIRSLPKPLTNRMLNASSCAPWIAWAIRCYARSSQTDENQAPDYSSCKLALNLAHLSALNAVGLHLVPAIASYLITVTATASAATASCLIIYNGM